MAYLKFGTEVEEHETLVPPLLPLELYGDAEEEVAQAAVAVVGSGVVVTFGQHRLSALEDGGPVLLQQGIVAVDAERAVTPAESDVEAPVRILLEVVGGGKEVETEFP